MRSGEVVGLLGPNGAGKTTLIRILSTTLLPTDGTARVMARDVTGDPTPIRREIGVIFSASLGLFARLSGRQNLRYFAGLYGITGGDADVRIERLAARQGLRDALDRKVAEYSTGMRQRLHLARVLLHDPSVLLLDEPTLGLDPVGARELRKAIRAMRGEGKAIVFCTHYMHEADEVCDRLVVLNRGEVLAEGTPAELATQAGDLGIIELTLPIDADAVAAELRSLSVVSASSEALEPTSRRVRLHSNDLVALNAAVTRTLAGLQAARSEPQHPTLEDVYVALLARSG